MKINKEILEKLAELEHKQWMYWSEHLVANEKLSKERVKRWKELWIPYDKLKESERESDRKWARIVAQILENHL